MDNLIDRILLNKSLRAIKPKFYQDFAKGNQNSWYSLINYVVLHSTYGFGTVDLVDESMVSIQFPDVIDEEPLIRFFTRDFIEPYFYAVILPEDFVTLIESKSNKKIPRQDINVVKKIGDFYNSLESRDLCRLQKLTIELNDLLPSNEYSIFVEQYEELKQDTLISYKEVILKHLESFNFDRAELEYQKIQIFYDRREFDLLLTKYKNKKDRLDKYLVKEAILQNLESFNFNKAEMEYLKYRNYYEPGEFDLLLTKYKNKKDRLDKYLKIESHLKRFEFQLADSDFARLKPVNLHEYEKLKSAYIGEYFKKHLNVNVSKEQTLALAKQVPNLLIKARAGSGKTRILACKTALLIDKYDINPDRILILAFNKKAAVEIGNRIRREFGFESYENARTFHSLAYQLVMPKKELIFDDGKGEFSRPKLSTFVQEVLREIWNPAVQTLIYKFFRREMQSIEYAGTLLDDKDYYIHLRNRRDISIGGNRVKSKGEKYIADFLFEHNISYIYERVEYWAGHNYRPDFVLLEKDIAIEFWGIDENDPNSQVPSWWDISWDQYYEKMQEKRRYWRDKNFTLIEFSIVDLIRGREYFEAILKDKLQSAGINCKKAPQKELEEKVIRNQIDRMTGLFVQFIQKAKKQMLEVQDVQKKIGELNASDERIRVFLDLACRVYGEYQAKLIRKDVLDFDDLLLEAANIIDNSFGECNISLGLSKDRNVRMKDLEWILIDEYQDFSLTFYNLIKKIQQSNPNVQLMCVGDDWQAINGFAGSDLRFLHEFNNFLPGSESLSLLTNFRSQKAIIDTGNSLMDGLGRPGMNLLSMINGEVIVKPIDQVWIEVRSGNEYSEARKIDQRFIFFEKRADGERMNDNGYLQAKYLKECYEIITDPENMRIVCENRKNVKDDIRVAILSRTNYLYRVTLKEFLAKLHSCLFNEHRNQIGDIQQKIRISTIHGFKGLEADIVIVLRACEGVIPLLHPDNYLFEIFGQSEKDILDEERRLFYVAITRAKEKLYILTEENRESDYLKEIVIESTMSKGQESFWN